MKKKNKIIDNPDQINLFDESLKKKQNVALTEQQKNFIEYQKKQSVILSACAGSGKTFSCVERLKYLVNDLQVDPSKIIFFSFTKAATEELKKRIGRDDIEIRTIHSYCGKVLTRLNRGCEIIDYKDFIDWFKNKNKLPSYASQEQKLQFEEMVSRLYDEAQYNSSQISAYKLQKESGIKTKLPDLWLDYVKFLRETKSRDMTDLLIEVHKLFKEDRYLRLFKDKYDYIFIDEYQDTSSIQMEVLLALNAKYYYLIGDKNQCVIEGTKVCTKNGQVNVEDIKIGDEVLSALGSNIVGYRKVINVISKKVCSDKKVVRINLKNGKELVTTDTHTHFVKSDEHNHLSSIINLKMCNVGRICKSSHSLQIKFLSLLTYNLLSKKGYEIEPCVRGWKISLESENYDELYKLSKEISDIADINIQQTISFDKEEFIFIQAHSLRKGMVMAYLNDKKEIEYDVIDRITFDDYEGLVYDIDVDNTHNFIANDIFTHNSIFSFSGSNCAQVENLLKNRRKTDTLNLSMNFRSDKLIIDNSNKYSSLQAMPSSVNEGFVDRQIMHKLEHLVDVFNRYSGEVAVLVRTNDTIKKMEYELLKMQVPMRYHNYITQADLKDFKKGDNMRAQTKMKFTRLKEYFGGSENAVASFILKNINSKKFITSIHKSKGLEYETCVVVNSIAPDVLEYNGIYDKFSDKQLEMISFKMNDDKFEEARNIHYVAVSRSKHNLFFMIYKP